MKENALWLHWRHLSDLFYCYTQFVSLPLPSPLRILAQITSAGRLAALHATASPESESSAAGVSLFYSDAVTFVCHVMQRQLHTH